MNDQSITVSSILDSKSTAQEKNARNIILWESAVIQMLRLPQAALSAGRVQLWRSHANRKT